MFAWFAFVRYFNWVTVQKTIACIIQKRLTGLAAEMAYHAMLGLFPAIIAVLSAVSLFEQSVETILFSLAIRFIHLIPIQVWTLLLEFIEDARAKESISWFSFSSIAAIWVISGVLSAAINALDRIHQVAPQHRRSYLQTKIVAVYLTIIIIAFLVVACFLLWVGDFLLQLALQQSWSWLLSNLWKIFSIIVAIAISMITTGAIYQLQTKSTTASDSRFRLRHRGWQFSILVTVVIVDVLLINLLYSYYLIGQHLIVSPELKIAFDNLLIYLWRIFGSPITLALVVLAFTSIYRHGASKRTANTPIFPGAILAAVSWTIVSLLFRLYVSHIGIYSKIYGAVGTVIILMLWLYLSSLVMLIGEQVNVIIGEAMAESSTALKKSAL